MVYIAVAREVNDHPVDREVGESDGCFVRRSDR
jgi:hypothetical protein